MEWWLVLISIFGSLIVMFSLGIPVAFGFLLIDIVGAFIYWGGVEGLNQIINSIYSSVANFSLVPVPLFILMGEIMFRSKVALHMMDALDKWLGRLPGRLSLLAVGGGALFASLSGSSIASTTMLGSILVPEMEKRGYKRSMSIGPIIGSGGLATMIPPTAIGVLLASLAKISVGKFLIAIIFPGLLMAFLYFVYIVVRSVFQPSLAPVYDSEQVPLREKIMDTVHYILPLTLIIFLVIGLTVIGVATPTESSALGVLGCLVLARFYGGFSWEMLQESLLGTLHITVMMFMILTGSTAFSQILAYSGATQGLVNFALGLDLTPIILLIVIQIIILLLGAFLDPLSIMMITLPIILPVTQTFNFDLIWFGVILLINLEMATTTPPFGLGLFAMKGVAPKDTTMYEIYAAALPFLLCDLLAMALIMAFPALALWLPGLIQ